MCNDLYANKPKWGHLQEAKVKLKSTSCIIGQQGTLSCGELVLLTLPLVVLHCSCFLEVVHQLVQLPVLPLWLSIVLPSAWKGQPLSAIVWKCLVKQTLLARNMEGDRALFLVQSF